MRPGRNRGRLHPQQRHLQRRPLRSRKTRQHAPLNPLTEIDQRRKRVFGLSAARPGHEHAQPSLSRLNDTSIPKRRLTDARPSQKHKGTPGTLDQKIAQRHALRLATHDTNIPLYRPNAHVPALPNAF